MKLVYVKDLEFNIDFGDVIVYKVIFFFFILEFFFNFIGIQYNFYIFGIYIYVVYWESFVFIYLKGFWRVSFFMICVYIYFIYDIED